MPKIVDHDAYRRELLHRSLAPFAEHGYAELTMRKLATELDVSTGTLYHYFPSKKVLFQQMLGLLAERDFGAAMDTLTPADGVVRVGEQIAKAARLAEGMAEETYRQMMLCMEYRRQEGPGAMDFMQGMNQSFFDLGRNVLGLDEASSMLVYATLSGLVYLRYAEEVPVDIAELGALLGQLLESHAGTAKPKPRKTALTRKPKKK